jgi:HEAT repeat protein
VASNQLLNMLSGGDLRSDGMANEVVAIVLANEELFEDLYDGFGVEDKVIRGRTADALEKVARTRPDLFRDHLSDLVQTSKSDPVAMVRWHTAMILGHLAVYDKLVDTIYSALIAMLLDKSAITLSWTVSSLAIIGRLYPLYRSEIILAISELQSSNSAAIRTRVRTALDVLADENAPFPVGWCKSEHLSP